VLFVILINDLCYNINNDFKLFADDTEVISISKSQEDKVMLQEDINSLNEWTNDWLVKLNMHLGYVSW
jgi:hypothetical protein